jgi:hypothetical protein
MDKQGSPDAGCVSFASLAPSISTAKKILTTYIGSYGVGDTKGVV